MDRAFFILLGILTLAWAAAVVALPFSATLYFLTNL